MTPEYAAAFQKMQAELPTVAKLRKGQEGKQNYKYADLASIMEAAMPVMEKHGFALMHKPVVETTEQGITHAGVEALLIHSSGGVESCRFTWPVTKEYGTLAKTVGGIITYARRYSMSILGICTEDDNDNGPGVGSKPMIDDAVAKPDRQPAPRESRPAGMTKATREKLKFAARERIKELGLSDVTEMEIIASVAKGLGYASPIEMLEVEFGKALETIQGFEPWA